MTSPLESFNEKYNDLVMDIDPAAFGSELETQKVKDLKLFSESLPAHLAPEPEPEPVPTTKLGQFWCGFKRAAASENFGIFIKSGFAALAVGGVTYATVKNDHVLEKQALAQANQTPR